MYRDLIALRRREPELVDPRLDRARVEHDAGGRTLVMHRGRLRVVVNLADASPTLTVRGADQVVYAPSGATLADGTVTLPPESFAIVRTSPDRAA